MKQKIKQDHGQRMKQNIEQDKSQAVQQNQTLQNRESAEGNLSSEEIMAVYKNYFNALEPSEELKNRMWRTITAGEKKKKQKFSLRIKLQAAVLAVICIALIFAVFGSRIAQIKTIQHLMNLCGIKTESDIIRNIIQEADVYAPVLWECNEETLIFATARGAVVYNRSVEKIIAVIDLQDIDCRYMNTNTISTKAYVENSKLWIFNEKNEEAYGNCYIYTIPLYFDSNEVQKLEPDIVCEAGLEHLEKWREYYSEHYCSAYEVMKNSGFSSNYKNDEKYSKEAFLWTTKDQKKVQSFLVTNRQNRECFLYTCGTDDTEFKEEHMKALNVFLTEEELEKLELNDRLPEYVYTGESAIFSVICEYLYNRDKESVLKMERYHRSMVWIPAPVIFDIVEENGEIKVFGNFFSYTYYKSGNTLECEGGGEMPACIHIKETDDSYEVISMERAGDGKKYAEDIKKFCKGHPFIQLKYRNYDKVKKKAEEMEKEFIKGYIASQGLDIEYYHHSGQDPVSIWEE